MDGSLIILLIVAVIAFVAFRKFINRKDHFDTGEEESQHIHQERLQSFPSAATIDTIGHSGQHRHEEKLQGFPYAVQNHFLSPAELSFFLVLRGVVGDRAIVSAKVSLGDVFWVKVEDKSKSQAYRNKIDRKHVDFLLCNSTTMQRLLGIELDDKSHERPDRQERDAFVDQVFHAAKLPLLHVPAKRAYIASELATQITPYLTTAPQATYASTPLISNTMPATAPPPSVVDNKAPPCPKCGSEMVLRTAKSGANTGNKFWGCSTYPNCRGMISLQ